MNKHLPNMFFTLFLLLTLGVACQQETDASGVEANAETVTDAAQEVAAAAVVPELPASSTEEAMTEPAASPDSSLPELKAETLGKVVTLPATYPESWVLVHDGTFFHMLDGRVVVVDAASDDPAGRFKGMFNAAFIAQFRQSTTRPEMYVAETFFSRGSRGDRTDVLTIYDKTTLAPIDEVVLPSKRSSNMPTQYNLQLADNESLALIYNFTPASSVTVVDLDTRSVLAEIPTPGCALAYPLQTRGFATLCGDGTILSVSIGSDAASSSSSRSEVFFDVETDAVMEKAVQHGGVTYFPTFMGNIVPVDTSGSEAVPGTPWSLLGEGDEGWRPGGLLSTGVDDAGRLYILMHPEGYEGSHKDPGVEIWVYDLDKKQRVSKINLPLPAISLGVTRGEKPLVLTTNIELGVDVYDGLTGEFLRTLDGIGTQTPFMIYGAR